MSVTAAADRSGGGTGPVAHHPLAPRYLAFVGGTGLSTAGDAAWMIALTATMTRLASPATVGLVLALAGLPRVVAMLGGGAMSDRRGPARVMIGADLLRFGLMTAAAVTVILTRPTVLLLVVLAAVLAFLGSFFVPASGALRPQLLPPEHLVRGNALYLVGLRGGQAAGGPAGAWLLGLGGIAAVAAVNALSFLASAAAVARCRPADRRAAAGESTPLRRRIAEGLRYVTRSRTLTTLIVVTGLVELSASGPVNIGLILLARNMGLGTPGAGLLLTAFTVGATVAYLAGLAFPVGRVASVICAVAVLVQAVALAGLGTGRSLWQAMGEYAAIGLAGGLSSLVLTSLIQRLTRTELRGRVMSIMSLLAFGSVPVGSATIGAMIEWFGRGTTMVLQGGLALAAVLVLWSAPGLRGARLD